MAKNQNESPIDWLKKMKTKGKELLSEMTAEEIEKEKEISKDLQNRMHFEQFGFLDGEKPPEGLEEREV